MSSGNQDDFAGDLENLMTFLKNLSVSDMTDEKLIGDLINGILAAREESVAKNFTSIEIGVIILIHANDFKLS